MESIGGNISGDLGDDCSIGLFAVLRSCWSARTDKPESINREDSPSFHFFIPAFSCTQGGTRGYWSTPWRLFLVQIPSSLVCVCVPWRRQLLLQELLDLVDIDLHLTVEGHKGRVGSRRQVLQVGGLPSGAISRRDVLSGKSVDRREWRRGETRAGLSFYLFRSTVVTLKMTPFSHRIMKSLWEKGQLPMLSPSPPACTTDAHSESSLFSHFHTCIRFLRLKSPKKSICVSVWWVAVAAPLLFGWKKQTPDVTKVFGGFFKTKSILSGNMGWVEGWNDSLIYFELYCSAYLYKQLDCRKA